MAHAQLPSDDELQRLGDAFRVNPGENFLELGSALCRLTRLAEAEEICREGLRVAPDHFQGRFLLGQILAMGQRWKEAQSELLKVVKGDRNHQAGFLLLGEVLLRRGDFERALPVLQHADALQPGNQKTHDLLRYAREQQPLPASPPPKSVPPPIVPRPSASPPAPPIAPPMQTPPALARMELSKVAVKGPVTPVPEERVSRRVEDDRRSVEKKSFPPVQHHTPPPPENPLAPLGGTPQAPAVRPRILAVEKPKDAAVAGLRESAAVGDEHLQRLLAGGLLDAPGVRVRPMTQAAPKQRHWGGSNLRILGFLATIVIAVGLGGGVWVWYTGRQEAAEASRFVQSARENLASADFEELATAAASLREALQRNPEDTYSLSALSQITVLSHALYGEPDAEEVQAALQAVPQDFAGSGKEGTREFFLAQTLFALNSRAHLVGQDHAQWEANRALLSAWLEENPSDELARWLYGSYLLSAGQYKDARSELEVAFAAGEGGELAQIAWAGILTNEGAPEKAIEVLDKVIAGPESSDSERIRYQELALAERALAYSLAGVPGKAMSDISIGLAKAEGARVLAWKTLAMARVQRAYEDYPAVRAALKECIEFAETFADPVLSQRIALVYLSLGEFSEARKWAQEVPWFAANPTPSPLGNLLAATQAYHEGRASQALELLGGEDTGGWAAHRLRGLIYLDLRRAEDALREFESAREQTPEDVEILVWTDTAKMLSAEGEVRDQANRSLESLSRRAKSKFAKYAHGMALARVGDSEMATEELTESVEELSPEYPNPFAYRSYLELARLAWQAGQADRASEFLTKSEGLQSSFVALRDLRAQLMVESDPEAAAETLEDVLRSGTAGPDTYLALARAWSKDGERKQQAVEALRKAAAMGAKGETFDKAVEEVDPELVGQF